MHRWLFTRIPTLAPWADPPHYEQTGAMARLHHHSEEPVITAWRETHPPDQGLHIGGFLR